MDGFFAQSEIGAITSKHSKKMSCLQCKLETGCISPRMEPSGGGAKGIYILNEAPGPTDDKQGTQLVGQIGDFLQEMLAPFKIDLVKDCIKDNCIRCRPPKSREPEDLEIESCRPEVLRSIELAQPKLILLLGAAPLKSFVGCRWKKALGGLAKWRGFVIPDREYNCWVAPVYHPSFVMKSEKKPVIKKIFKDDLANAFKYLKKPIPNYSDELESVRIISGVEVENLLKRLLRKAEKAPFLLAFDYETTGKKPHAAGHEIVCMSMCWDGQTSYAFMFPVSHTAMDLLFQVLTNPRIEKTGHNIQFEDTWTSVIWKIKIQGWKMCSMQAGHILDNRQGIAGLKFLSAVNFGLYSYDEEIHPYLESIDPKNANSFNRIKEAPKQKLLLYCGVDSLVQYRLAIVQIERFKQILGVNEFIW